MFGRTTSLNELQHEGTKDTKTHEGMGIWGIG
jgi:hypothetical protein